MAQGHRSLEELDGLPAGLDGLYADSLKRVVKLGKEDWLRCYAPGDGNFSPLLLDAVLDVAVRKHRSRADPAISVAACGPHFEWG
jgi:hypothetical protein